MPLLATSPLSIGDSVTTAYLRGKWGFLSVTTSGDVTDRKGEKARRFAIVTVSPIEGGVLGREGRE